MAREIKILENLRDLGFKPVANTAILVKYDTPNLSAKIVDFFNLEYYVLQICENELVLIPFNKMTGLLKKETTLALPFEAISDLKIAAKGLDYHIDILSTEGEINLITQQKELADLRISSSYANDTFLGLGSKNWHKENLDNSLEKLKELVKK